MDAERVKALFEPFGLVTVKRMFGGHSVYIEGLCFAIEHGGEVFLKVDAESAPGFAAAGSSPFITNARGKAMPTSFWRLPSAARDDATELTRWAVLGLEAARRAAADKAKPRKARPAKGKRAGGA
jgi:DNA transformation protein and related proteins